MYSLLREVEFLCKENGIKTAAWILVGMTTISVRSISIPAVSFDAQNAQMRIAALQWEFQGSYAPSSGVPYAEICKGFTSISALAKELH